MPLSAEWIVVESQPNDDRKWTNLTRKQRIEEIKEIYGKKGEDVDKTGLVYFAALSLKVTTAGAVTATMTYDTGKTKKDSKTKKMVKVYYKPTCSTVVIPTSAADVKPFEGHAFLYFAPSSTNNFPRFVGVVPF